MHRLLKRITAYIYDRGDVTRGVFWTSAGQFLILLLSFATNIWLARIISVDEFGRIGILMFFILLGNMFVEGGLSGALVRKETIRWIDYDTVFVYNFVIGLTFTILLVLISPLVCTFYKDETLKYPLIVLALTFVINSISLTEDVKLIITMKHKRRHIYLIIATFFSGLAAIIAAYSGLGLWSLILLQITRSIIFTICLSWNKKLRIPTFDINSFKSMHRFGFNTLLSSGINVFFDNINQLVLAKYFNLIEVGYYYQARKIQEIPTAIFSTVNQSVLYSAYSKLQNDTQEYETVFIKNLKLNAYFYSHISIFLIVFANIIIKTLLPPQWSNVSFYLSLLAYSMFFLLTDNYMRISYKIFNKTGWLLTFEGLKKAAQITLVILGIVFGNIILILLGMIISNILGLTLSILKSPRLKKEVFLISAKASFIHTLICISFLSFNRYTSSTLVLELLFGLSLLLSSSIFFLIFIFDSSLLCKRLKATIK